MRDTGKYLRVQELLRRLPGDTPPERLRSLLAPLFATDAAGQRLFYEIFDKSLAQARRVTPNDPNDPNDPNAPIDDNDPNDPNAPNNPNNPNNAITSERRWRRLVLWFPPLLAALAGFVWDGALERWYGNPATAFALAVLAAAAWAAWKLLNTWPARGGYLLAVLAVLVAGAVLKSAVLPAPALPVTRPLRFPVAAGDTATQNLLLPTDTARLLLTAPRDLRETPLRGQFFVDSAGTATYIAHPGATPGRADTMTALLAFADRTDTVLWIADLLEKDAPLPPPDAGRMAEIALPYPRDIAELRVDAAAAARFAWYRRYEWPLKAVLMLLLGGLAWAIVRWDQYRRARAVAEIRRSDRAPYVWKPDTGADAAELMAAAAQPLLARLRGRAPGDRFRLDARATVRATSRNAGRATFAWRRRTLPPNFLLLIDRLGPNDHRALLFDALYRAFVKAEAPVSRYFYDGDPRRCFDETHPGGIALAELLHRHAGAQLLLVGDGHGLIDPGSGRPAAWTTLLDAWPRRVLLNPTPLAAWGSRERQLADLLPLLPASPGGLSAALDLFAATDPTDARDLLRTVRDAHTDPVAFEHELLDDLHRRFAPQTVDWIAACALWPTLHWELTLYLGQALGETPPLSSRDTAQPKETPPRPSPRGEGAASAAWTLREDKMGDIAVSSTSPSPLGEGRGGVEPNGGSDSKSFSAFLQLTRLPWFTEGRIPDGARARLLDHLAARGLETPLREALRALLRQAPAPPGDSAAYDDYRMNVALNELLLRPDPATRRRLEREFERYLAAGKKPDFVALRLLDRPTNRLDVLVGERLKKYAFREGLPGLGWRLAPKLAALWLGLAGALALFQPDLNPCPGQRVPFGGTELCLNDARDSLLYLEYLAADAIERGEHARVDSLRAAADAIRPRDTVFYRNTAARYHNRGAWYWNCAEGYGERCDSLPADSLRAKALACEQFGRAAALDSAEVRIRLALARCGEAAGRPVAYFETPVANCCAPCTVQFNNLSSGAVFFSWNFGDGSTAAGANPTHIYMTPGTYYITLAAVSATGAADTLVQPLVICTTAAATADEQNAWREAQKTDSPATYEGFLAKFPNGAYATEARQRLAERRDEEAWMRARLANTPEACRQYLAEYPQGKYAADARACATPVAPANQSEPEMVLVRGGRFTMGCQDEKRDGECYDDEKPPRQVTVSDFYIGRYEVTQALWRAVMGEDPPTLNNKNCDQCPVERVSWDDIQDFLQKLNARTGKRYRLPTEAEWEFAARGGNLSKGYLYSGSNDLKEVGWYNDNSQTGNTFGIEKTTRPAGTLKPNELGIYDMSGNVWEWVEDDWHDNYQGAPTDGKAWVDAKRGTYRVRRGGSWISVARYCRAACRSYDAPDNRSLIVGFRLALSPQ